MAVQQVTDTEFANILAENDKVVVKYYADWCGNCRLFSPKYKRMSESEAFKGEAFPDVNAETNPGAR